MEIPFRAVVGDILYGDPYVLDRGLDRGRASFREMLSEGG